ncbi:bifunctional folylpolyglutamate synthase/dihydrofolate synthase [Stappia taiwanensis]|uniref:Dihydrofolate synthase/folylpolyglutamate synthase n=1 Tax=Stappia taiwanensis TaxID=992267 RepID=A0A838XXW9_9HYPH|nr:folylpolyglutamate synthase/dihydrofolate synthase family protein [Stappia taiwanensis]MBA4611884.1 bifunctional folylpolyglutamate synthase/dihydrofolate synthase [Stappia taiwanensis]GGF03536.1 bifunctional folylpolyglutamate synthase/dihydrofolate synthase [Stappia taiwanensis]
MDQVTAILDRLLALHPREIDLSLGRLERLLRALGNPEQRVPPVIHITGTNGKGSTTAIMRAILEAAGRKVHVYTSPHLVSFNERIRLAGELVSDERLIDALDRCEQANAGAEITFFEVTTAAAMLLFSEVPADILLLEVGLGGRLDATNVIKAPLASVITPLSMDHERYLGAALTDIAFEKAGILKPGAPAVIAPQPEEAAAVIAEVAADRGADLTLFGQDFTAYEEHGRFTYQDEAGLLDLPRPRLAGRHQIINAGMAIAALRRAGCLPDVAAIEQGLASVDWPGRLQPLTRGPVVDLCPDGAEVWLDGGHNPGASTAIAAFIGEQEERDARPLYLVTGMLKTKDPVGFFAPYAGLARHVATVPLVSSAVFREPEELVQAARAAGLDATPFAGLEAALSSIVMASHDDPEPPRVLICGSLYLVGEVLALNGMRPV